MLIGPFCKHIFINKKIRNYYPGRRFRYYRISIQSKLKMIRYVKIAIIPISFFNYYENGLVFCCIVAFILYAVLWVIRGNVLQSSPNLNDDALVFELEERNMIPKIDNIIAFYKDFRDWDEVYPYRTILLLTPDTLIQIELEDTGKFERNEYLLCSVKQLGITPNPVYKDGFMIAILTTEDQYYEISMVGETTDNKPMNFFYHFLIHLDNALLTSPNNFVEPQDHETSPSYLNQITEQAADSRGSNNDNPIPQTPRSKSKGRIIDL